MEGVFLNFCTDLDPRRILIIQHRLLESRRRLCEKKSINFKNDVYIQPIQSGIMEEIYGFKSLKNQGKYTLNTKSHIPVSVLKLGTVGVNDLLPEMCARTYLS